MPDGCSSSVEALVIRGPRESVAYRIQNGFVTEKYLDCVRMFAELRLVDRAFHTLPGQMTESFRNESARIDSPQPLRQMHGCPRVDAVIDRDKQLGSAAREVMDCR